VLPNLNGTLRPGLFVTAKVAVGTSSTGLVISKSALQTFEGKTVVFVRTDKGFEPKPVELGRKNEATVEILSGLELGQTYVTDGSFTLKAQLSKGAFGDGHNH
jgi:cobalt-zinc-cadmium efflux system membrane fusion protein